MEDEGNRFNCNTAEGIHYDDDNINNDDIDCAMKYNDFLYDVLFSSLYIQYIRTLHICIYIRTYIPTYIHVYVHRIYSSIMI